MVTELGVASLVFDVREREVIKPQMKSMYGSKETKFVQIDRNSMQMAVRACKALLLVNFMDSCLIWSRHLNFQR